MNVIRAYVYNLVSKTIDSARYILFQLSYLFASIFHLSRTFVNRIKSRVNLIEAEIKHISDYTSSNFVA